MSSENKNYKKGIEFEHLVSKMFQNFGYLSRRGIPLQYGNSQRDATDIDVLGITFTGLFQEQRIICDCKNKARSKPHERIFWAKGLGDFVKASAVYVALNKTKSEIIKFASKSDVKIITSEMVNTYLEHIPGDIDNSNITYQDKEIKSSLKSNIGLNDIFMNYKKLYLSYNPYSSINIILTYLENISKIMNYNKNNENTYRVIRYLACELTIILSLQFMRICSDVLGFSENERREHIKTKLTFGDSKPNVTHRILKDASDLANEIIKSSIPNSLSFSKMNLDDINPPSYTEDLIGLVERALLRPNMYLYLPQTLNNLLIEQGLEREDHINMTGQSFQYYQGRKAAQNILSFVRVHCNINWKQIWESLKINKQANKMSENSSRQITVDELIKEKDDLDN